MATTPNLLIPYLEAAQSQKHVTHNEALTRLDAVVQIGIADRDLATPPASPADGVRYIVAVGANGAWSGHATKIAAFQDGTWEFYAPREGWLAWVADEDTLLVWNGGSWINAGSGGGGGGSGTNPTPLVGVNATADTTNRLSVAAPASLLSHEGAGHQLKINKSAAADTASLVFQTGFSGRAEMGLSGDDDWRIKVSADGTAWTEAVVVNRTTGAVTFPNTSIGGGTSDHGALAGLADDDHAQYHTDTRGDARYYTKAQIDSSLSAKAGKAQIDFISGLIKSPANQDYRLVINVPHGGTITKATTRAASGTCTATFKINSSPLGGTANAVSSTEQEQAHSSSNVFAAGDDIILTVSANASCADMSFTLEFTRTLA